MARKCVLCKQEYEYCPSCPKDSRKPLWYKLYCSDNCHNIFEALNKYNFKMFTKEETQAILSQCDLTIKLNDHYRGEINEIMAKPKRGARAKVFIADEVMPEEIKEEVQEELDGVVTIE